jgi:hypothetical protein
MNGVCKCRKGFSGVYCQYSDDSGASFSTILFYFATFLFICALIVGLFYGAIRTIRYIEAEKQRIAEEEAARGREFDDNEPIVNNQQPADDNKIIGRLGEPTITSQYEQNVVRRRQQ